MTLSELQAKWEARRTDGTRLGASVSLSAIAADVLSDLQELAFAVDAETLSLTDAAKQTNYHPGSIARLIKEKKVTNYGTRARPRVKLSELPRKSKPAALRAGASSSAAVFSPAREHVLAIDASASRLGRSTRPPARAHAEEHT